MTDFTRYKDIWRVHFNLDNPVTRAGFTTTTFDVKGESSLLVATDFRFIGLSKEVSNVIKYTCVSGWVGTRCPSNRALVNINQAIQMFNSRNGLELAWLVRIAIEFLCNSFFKMELTKVDLPEPDTLSPLQIFQVETNCYILQVVFFGTYHL